ncbi:hypothetical protein JQT66_16950 [Sulfitobacter mediterraneus]|uniref:hypothetical protein n=1 Tax=Sulfitobacter mediterraneus TaxID=83219 RepID=UPI001931EF62|nr:hypothetical protein [Sulfitobacter mediterraneus]MBM1311930.1 hypothetical protein [Sulfitobacter mediterraneus]MBM1315811.1 hypothetical protein [Sulfitobacter mediterraneus]MBM1324173.1 hypothetical protein [Sulfitobacter mediterraneus]MBM1328085.1 hypothetical protein [Sulfitobacter mediterraneus]MBM1399433.1 hypothetical protein [Sulfitobacter mediterraneus]
MTVRKPARRKTTRRTAPQTLGERVDAAVAETTARGFVWLGRSLIGLVAMILWPIRLWLIMLGAGIAGFWQGARDEYRLIREEWREDRIEQERLARTIETAWHDAGLTTPEARARATHLPDDQNPDLVVNGTAMSRKEVLRRVGLDAVIKHKMK